ncbi:MAG TPA: hypothetical protein VGL77_14405 [Armatimonadota bacterium]
MAVSLVIAVYYYDGYFYVPTCVRALDGRVGITAPITTVAADDRAALAEAIELHAVAGNATLSNADFRNASDSALLAAMHLPNRQSFYTKTQRWSIVEDGGVYTLIPFKAAALRGVVEDSAHAVTLNPATFASEATQQIKAQLLTNLSGQ